MLSRKELAELVFGQMKADDSLIIKDIDIWKAIATTDDKSLLRFYHEHLIDDEVERR